MRTFPGRDHVYDITVIGAGIAGSEAALAAARAGRDVLLVTTSLDSLYMLAHGQAQLDPPAGTLMAELLEASEQSGEPVDRWTLHRRAKYALEAQSGIHLLQSSVDGLIVDEGRVIGVRTWEGVERRARVTALCVGSFLEARLEQGSLREVAGRLGEMAYDELFNDLVNHGLSFVPETFELQEATAGLPYRVSCRILASSELAEDGMTLSRLEALHAAGVCASGVQTYEESAAAGMALGVTLGRATG